MTVSLGMDLGEKRIGIAVSDEMGLVANSLVTLAYTGRKHFLEDFKKILSEYNPKMVVVGLPKTLKGETGPAAQRVLDQVEWLKKEIPLKWVLWDERFTTQEVEKMLISADISRGKRKKVKDALAAQRILQSYLDSKRGQSG